jgi:hypothetical protein
MVLSHQSIIKLNSWFRCAGVHRKGFCITAFVMLTPGRYDQRVRVQIWSVGLMKIPSKLRLGSDVLVLRLWQSDSVLKGHKY